jgi:structural maintenance of chromosome 3 (chondroitin sulfate proteoglycan 6)
LGFLLIDDRELWREDAKLDTTVGHARDELRAAERALSTMMDKVCYHSLHETTV